ncbi:G patch domain-containing protein 2-like [Mya arenaria]|uniref:G patch domain-containing protein 2-like n=1 Tax=Mya arenaria TaxID=6604 RepID=UPI0022E11ACD|nr:G patch domain-containing protein 2-like [Mya arenaria]
MENNIVSDFERLRVFSSSIGKMDDLVHDLSMALEDAASHKRSKSDGGHGASSSSTRRHPRKRRGRRKRHQPDNGNFSETSQSSIDEALKDYMENCAQSDSDDLTIAHHIVRLTMPLSINYVPTQVESDSVNESLFSPIRPQRRRKKYKTMAIDPDPSSSQHDSPIQGKPKFSRPRSKTMELPRCSMGTSPMDGGGFPQINKEGVTEDTVPGKRKRNSRKTDFQADDCFNKDDDSVQDSTMNSQESSSSTISSSCSSDSVSGDEYCVTAEADDEQSDFFHESGPASGIPGVIPWWENDGVNSGDETMVSDKHFQQILTGSFQHLSRSSQVGFKARMTRIMRHCGREIRFGRRKLRGKIPGYTVQHFIQERHKWNSIQGKLASRFTSPTGVPTSNTLTDSKRQRKTPPPIFGLVGGDSEPIPDTNIGNRMLQQMGWNPGQGLGIDGTGIRTPVLASTRPHRQGLGCDNSTQGHGSGGGGLTSGGGTLSSGGGAFSLTGVIGSSGNVGPMTTGSVREGLRSSGSVGAVTHTGTSGLSRSGTSGNVSINQSNARTVANLHVTGTRLLTSGAGFPVKMQSRNQEQTRVSGSQTLGSPPSKLF